MTSHSRNTSSIAYLLLCFFITSATAHSFIRQFTDGDLNTNLQQTEEVGAEPIRNLDVGHYLQGNKEISSRDYKVSASNAVKGLRDRPPSSYSLKMESFNTLLKSTYTEKYASRPFSVGGYNWTLVVFPNGNKKDGGSGYLSLYVAIDNSTLVAAQQEIYADLRFYIFNKNERKYFTIQDTDVWKFSVFKTMWGFSQVLSIDTFKDPINGYLYDGDHCEFGVDVTIPSLYEKSELFTVTENFQNPRFTWTIRGFSTLLKDTYLSDVFTIGGRSWNIQVNPSGHATGEGKALSMYLNLNVNEIFRPYEKIYVRANLRVLNQRNLNNVERPLDIWYNGPGYGAEYSWGYPEFISLSDLRDVSKGFVVNDVLMVQVEMEAISSTKYFPIITLKDDESPQKHTSSVVYLLFCLFITSSSADSFIGQFTDDFTTTLKQKGKDGPIPNLEEANNLHKHQEISSRDYEVSASNIVKGLRDDPPSSYSLKIESFNSLIRTYVLRFESRPFSAGGYNWRLVVYPSGNWWDTSSGYLSLYVAIDDSTPIAAHQEVHADLRFYIFNNNERKYLTIQDIDVWKFSASKKIWGFPQVLSTDVFKDLRNGYLYDGDQCKFGVDVTIASHYQKSESFSVTESFYNPTFTWTIRGFSTLLKESYQSDVFSIGGRSWYIHVFPNGRGEGKAMSMYLNINWDVKFKPFEKIYARAKLRVLNQRNLNNVERQLTNWYIGPGYGSGDSEIISLADLRDSSKGFVVNDMLKVQVQLEAISSTMYFPS